MRNYIKSAFFLFVYLVIFFVAVALAEATPLTRVSYGSSSIEWEPQGESVSLLLVVTGPEAFVFRREFDAGVPPVFHFFHEEGASLPEGGYNWELRGRPERRPEEPRTAPGKGRGSRLERKQAGFFRIQGGGLVAPSLEDRAEFETKDLINDDLFVIGNACVGLECVDGQSFGDEVLLLKDDVVRIRLQDTSSASGDPTNDWEISANDAANGGADKFSIEDVDGGETPFTIEAGAPSDALYVDDIGRVGLGTSTPTADLHIVNGDPAVQARITVEGDAPGVRLTNTGSAGGSFDLMMNANTGRFLIENQPNRYPLKIGPDAYENLLRLGLVEDKLVEIFGDLDVSGTTTSSNLELAEAGPDLRFTNSGSAGGAWSLQMNPNTGRLNFTDDTTSARIPVKLAPGADNNLLRVGVVASDRVDVDGDLVVTGTITPDYVFAPDYELESIEEHAAFMWDHQHLPAVPPARTNGEGKGVIHVGARSQGVLEELEKAHIYIEQLHSALTALQSRIEKLEESAGAKLDP